MKKTFTFLWCALMGCSVIPDGSFESPPKATLKKIVMTANESERDYIDGLPVSTLTGTVSHAGSKTVIDFQGSLDPFWFVDRVDKIEYEYNSQDLVSRIVLTFEGGGTQLEEFSYNDAGALDEATISYENAAGTDVTYQYGFYYTIDHELDSIAKEVVLVNGTTEVHRGFFKARDDEQEDYITHRRFYSIFPYEQGQTTEPVDGLYCGSYPSQEYYNKSFHNLPVVAPYNFLDYKTVVERDGEPYGEEGLFIYTTAFFPYTNKVKQFYYDSRNIYSVYSGICVESLPGPSYYRLVPEMNFNYAVLEMLNIAEERYWVGVEPERMTKFKDLKVEFEYNYAE